VFRELIQAFCNWVNCSRASHRTFVIAAATGNEFQSGAVLRLLLLGPAL
jgi:hypothetical protein